MELAFFINGVLVGAAFVILYDLCCLATELKRNAGDGGTDDL